ncbi:protein kinase domain-containing protein [Paraliomyxa miuraensis]|uniref:protein kinase domain-containing protein n=1 Tax=Paraliomyxa miuraensis TaxID=376150 RepID=UPI00225B87B2|nr:tetratricopeptide repeat protein [Paraliomyxa miuraensis]MCX4244347.1 tetratricopeptide repeat protein [Paraliomyxa miuraensis]
MMECPEENVIVDFVRGELPKPERAALEAHLDECETCSLVVAEMARLFTDEGPDLPEPDSGPDRSSRSDLIADDVGMLDTDGAFSPSAITHAAGEILDEPGAMLPQGAKLGRYVVLDRVGAGGMGVVYAAFDPELDRKVALKVLRRRSSHGDKQGERLMREAQAMAKLSHPNVITVHDVGTFEGQVFLAMEFIEGQTLGDWLKAHTGSARSWRAVLDVFLAAGRGLAAAHAVGLVHRDFKPDNVLLGRDGRVLVTDFGLARPAAGKTDAFSAVGEIPSMQVLTASLTQTGAVVGTPAYMAPEQLAGGRPGPRTDQFSFCVALYEGLYGKRPFRGKSFAELASNVSSGSYAPAPRNVAVPRRVRRALFRGLATEPEQRFETMDELLHALHHDPSRRWRRSAAVMLPAGLLLVGGIVVSQVRGGESSYCDHVEAQLEGVWDDARREAVTSAFRATGRAYAEDALAATSRRLDDYAARWTGMQAAACQDQVRGEQPQAVLALRMHCLERRLDGLRTVVDVLAHADAAVVEGAVDAARGLARLEPCEDLDALTQAMPAPPDSPRERAEVAQLERKLAEAGVLREAMKLDQVEALCREVADGAVALGYRPLEAEALVLLATTFERGGRYPEAEATYHHALSAALAAGHAQAIAQAAEGLVWITSDPGRPAEEPERWAAHGLASLEALGPLPELEAQLHHALAVARLNHGRLDQAEHSLERSVEIREAAMGKEHHSLGAAMSTLGQLMAARGRRDEAVDAFRRARRHVTHEYGTQHPLTATVVDNLATSLSERGDYEEAGRLQQQALEIREANLDPGHPEIGVSHMNMAATLQHLGRMDESKAHGEQALAILSKVYGEDGLDVAGPLNNLSNVEEALGQLDAALEHRSRALELARRHLGDEHPRVVRYREAVASLRARLGHTDEAEQ